MKFRCLSYITLFVLLASRLQAQTVDSLWHGYLSPVVQTGGSAPNFQFQGAFNSEGGFSGGQISLGLGPRLVFYNNNRCYELPITAITQSGSIIAGTANDPSGQLSALPGGVAAIFVRSAVQGIAPNIAGLPAPLSACIQTATNLKLDSLRARMNAGLAPSGSAGGALAGSYPNPQLAVNAVDSTKITNNAVGTGEIRDGQVTTQDLAPGAVTSQKVGQFRATNVVYVSPTATASKGRVGDINYPVATIQAALDSLFALNGLNDSTALIVLLPGNYVGSTNFTSAIDSRGTFVKMFFMEGAFISAWPSNRTVFGSSGTANVELSGDVKYTVTGSASYHDPTVQTQQVIESGRIGETHTGPATKVWVGNLRRITYDEYFSGTQVVLASALFNPLQNKRIEYNIGKLILKAGSSHFTNFDGTTSRDGSYCFNAARVYSPTAQFLRNRGVGGAFRHIGDRLIYNFGSVIMTTDPSAGQEAAFEFNCNTQVDTGSTILIRLGSGNIARRVVSFGKISTGCGAFIRNATFTIDVGQLTSPRALAYFREATITNSKIIIRADNFVCTGSEPAILFENCTITNSEIVIEGNFETTTSSAAIQINSCTGSVITIRNAFLKSNGGNSVSSANAGQSVKFEGVFSAASINSNIVPAGAIISVGAGGANDSRLQYNVVGNSDITLAGTNSLKVTESGQTITLQADTAFVATKTFVANSVKSRPDTQYVVVPIVAGNTAINQSGVVTLNTGFLRLSGKFAGYKVRNLAYTVQTAGTDVGQSIQFRAEINGIAQADSEVTLNTSETRKEIATTAAAYTVAAGDLYRVIVQTNTFTSNYPGGLNLELMLVR